MLRRQIATCFRTLIAVANGRFYGPLWSMLPRLQIATCSPTLIAVANGRVFGPPKRASLALRGPPSIFYGPQTLASLYSWRPSFRASAFLIITILPYVSNGI